MTEFNDPDQSFFAGMPGAAEAFGLEDAGCGCWTCVHAIISQRTFPGNLSYPFIVCPECGNKRCPKATHHDHACTGSNDPGQTGSRYA